LHGVVHVLAEITFPFYLWVILIWIDNTYFLFELFFLEFWFGSFWYAPFFLLSFFLEISYPELNLNMLMILVQGIFERNFLFFRLKEGAMKFYWCFTMNKHGHISFWIMIAWFLKRLTPATDFSDSQYLSFFLSLPLSYLFLRLPFAGFQSNGLLFFFLLISFFECL